MSYICKNKPIKYKRISQYYKAKTHKGIDLAAPTGTSVYATCDGTVVAAKYGAWDSSYGNMVAIYHGNGDYTNHAHLSKIKVKVGQKVTAGQLIGLCGSTGHSTGPHVHFEVHKGRKWNRVNPWPYLRDAGYVSNNYKVGSTYILQEDMNIRISPKSSAAKVSSSKWTKDAQKHKTDKGLLAKGTKITCKDVAKNSDGSTWIKTPSGYICAIGSSGRVFIK
jgi:co-chaperonin GroES (HSP10)